MEKISALLQSSWGCWIEAGIILIIGIVAFKILAVILKKILIKSKLDEALHKFVLNSVKVVILLLTIVAILSKLGVNTSTFIAVIGAAGAAIALALKDGLSNVAGGIIILVTKPFSKGDYVLTNDIEGTVQEIDILNTTLKTVDNKTVSIPNGAISNNVLVNFTETEARRVDIKVAAGYESDIQSVKRILNEVADECDLIIKSRDYIIGVSEHGESALIFDFGVWTKPENYWKVKYYLGEKVKEAFDKNGVSIPYNHVDVTIKN